MGAIVLEAPTIRSFYIQTFLSLQYLILYLAKVLQLKLSASIHKDFPQRYDEEQYTAILLLALQMKKRTITLGLLKCWVSRDVPGAHHAFLLLSADFVLAVRTGYFRLLMNHKIFEYPKF